MGDSKTIYKIGLAVFRDGKVLLTRERGKQDAFYMLGGRVEEGESELETVEREVMEEVGCRIKSGSLRYLEQFEAPAHSEPGLRINEKIYTGELVGEPKPMGEVEELRYFDSTIEERYLNQLSTMYMNWFKQNGYIA